MGSAIGDQSEMPAPGNPQRPPRWPDDYRDLRGLPHRSGAIVTSESERAFAAAAHKRNVAYTTMLAFIRELPNMEPDQVEFVRGEILGAIDAR